MKGTINVPLLASQVTGIMHMLYRICGTFPMSALQKADDQYQEILQKFDYDCPPVRGGFLEDTPGMGKTYTACGFWSWWSQYADHIDERGNDDNRPSLLLVPEGYVFKQWVDAISIHFPHIKLIVAKTGKLWDLAPGEIRTYNSLNQTQVKKCRLPDELKYVFDKTYSNASRSLIISSYKTWRHRTCTSDPAPPEKQNIDPRLDGCCKKKNDQQYVEYWVKKWKGKFAMTMLDEGHITRNSDTMLHWMVRRMQAPINWLLTATPIMNNAGISGRSSSIVPEM